MTDAEDTKLAHWLADANNGRGPDPAATLHRSDYDTLIAAVKSQRDAQCQVDAAVMRIREHGAPWAVIGEALGISRQAAHERYSAN